ncbi:hypothetical protein [Methylobacterium frigidaeris]|uniref:hypothetical protein n=1 Tax=Methylobacterium frigidaeris TaxID=2038277 RepID=UPI001EE09173|nr:hypothetical protein [Methylobacterium frigidaeris]
MADYLTNRDGIWYLVRRVPDTVAALDRRVIVRQTTKVRVAYDPRGAKARRVVDALNADLETYWRGLLAGQSQDAQERYDAARRRARGFGFDYRLTSSLAELPDDELLARIRTIVAQPRSAEAAAVTAVLGGEALAPLRLSTLFAEFERLSAAANRDLSPDQQRKWRNPKLRAIANLVDVTGDRPLEEVTRATPSIVATGGRRGSWRRGSRSPPPTRISATSTRCSRQSSGRTGSASGRSSVRCGSAAMCRASAPPSRPPGCRTSSWPRTPLTGSTTRPAGWST